jgi:hypothetical protein
MFTLKISNDNGIVLNGDLCVNLKGEGQTAGIVHEILI